MLGGRAKDAEAIGAVALLDDDVRRELYVFIRRQGRPVTREQAADGVGISRKLAAFHLDKLAAARLLRVAPPLTAGPRRVGRAPKAYEPVDQTVQVSIPARAHADLAAILVDAASSQSPDETPAEARRRAASEHGRAVGGEVGRRTVRSLLAADAELIAAEAALDNLGYEPYRPREACVRMRNCPFHPLAERAPALVCGLNEAFVEGVLDGLGLHDLTATLAPSEGECCVEITAGC